MQTAIDFDPPHSGTATSIAAARSIRPVAATLRERVFAFVDKQGMHGATAEEIERALKMSGNTVRPRILELRAAKRMFDRGNTRETQSGRQATVWVAKQ